MKPFLLIGVLAILNSAPLSADVLLAVVPQAQIIAPGTTTSIELRVSGLGVNSAPSLGAFDLNLAFNPVVVAFTGLTFGDPVQGDQLSLSGVPAISDFSLSSAGVLDLFSISLDSANLLDTEQADQFVLATLSFQAIAPGSTALTLSINSVSDSEGNPLSVALQTGSIAVTSVPEPSAIWLFPPALACVAWRRNRRRQRSSLSSSKNV
jgi:hypothetical protein